MNLIGYLMMILVLTEHEPQPPPKPQPMGPWQIKKKGSLEKSMVRRYVRLHLPVVRHCYVLELGKQPKLQATVAVSFTIDATGLVSKSESGTTTLERCVAKAVGNIRFPKVFDLLTSGYHVLGDSTQVTYRFKFRPAKRKQRGASIPASWDLPDRLLNKKPLKSKPSPPASGSSTTTTSTTPAPPGSVQPKPPKRSPPDPNKVVPIPSKKDNDPLGGLDLSAP